MMKIPRVTIGTVALALILAASTLSAAERIRVGRWLITSTNNGKANAFKNCVGKAEADAVNGDAKSGRAYTEKLLGGHCAFTEYSVEGSVVTSVMTCGRSTVRTVTTYQGDHFQSDSKTKIGDAPEAASHIDAKRIGDCP